MRKNMKLTMISLFALGITCATTGAFAFNSVTTSADTEDVFHELGASIRVAEDEGIRFAFGLPEDCTGDDYTIGTLIIPKALLGEGELTTNVANYENIVCTKNWVSHDLLENVEPREGYNYYNAALTKIPDNFYNKPLVARSYYVKDGVYTYSDPVERSIGWVAAAALNYGFEDTKGILSGIVSTGFGETEFDVNGDEFITVNETPTFTAENNLDYRPVWSSSNEAVATVDTTGKVTPEKGGEAEITATIAGVEKSKTVYVVGDGLYSDQIGIRINGWQQQHVSTTFSMATGDNGEMVVTAKFQANATYAPALTLRNIYSKAYYQALVDNGYAKFEFNLAVEGDLDELYVFGKAINTFPQKDGVYTISIDAQHFVTYYDTLNTIATSGSQVGQASSISAKFITWKSPAEDYTSVRNYTFTISNPEFKLPTLTVDFAEGSKDFIKVGDTTTLTAETNMAGLVWSSSDKTIATVEDGVVTGVKGGEVTITATVGELSASKTVYVVGEGLYSNQIGMRIGGYQYQDKPAYFNMATGNNGEMVVTAKFQANPTYAPALTIRNLYSKAYYQALVNNGYTKLLFNLAVEGDLDELYVFGKAINTFPQTNGVYTISIDTQHFVTYYDTMSTIATSGSQVGQASSITAKFITWKSPANEWNATRDYVFTISNAAFMPAATLEVTADKTELAYGETATLTATTNWDVNNVVWSSSNEAIATVENGVVSVTGVESGEVVITATVGGVSKEVTITVKAPTLTVDFAEGSKDLIKVGDTTTLNATIDWKTDNLVWSSSNAAVATVEDGVVTGVKGGEVTITATVGEWSASKTVYVVGDGLYSDQIGMRIGGYQYQDKPAYFNMATGNNGEMVVTAKFQANATYAPALTIRNLYNKAYYQALVNNGYTKLVFNLAVEGDLDELYVFGKAINTFPQANGVYTISIDTQHFVTYYDTMSTIATSGSQVGQASSITAKFITWKSPANEWNATRDYVFTISNTAFMPAATLAVTADKTELAYGETATLTATTNWGTNNVVWSTSDKTIATVENGVVSVTGVESGEVVITATVGGVSEDVTITVKAPTTMEVAFAEGSKDIIEAGKTTTLNATIAWNKDCIVWSSSNVAVATVENGVVTGLKSGEVTITATVEGLTVEKTIYVVGGLNSNQIGVRNNGWQQTGEATIFNMATDEQGNMTITAKFSDSDKYYPMLMLRNMNSKEYYQALVNNGYTKLTFMLGVGGTNAADVSDLYVFGTKLTNFPKGSENGTYAVTVDVQYILTYYDNIYGIATSTGQAGQSGSLDKMFIAWKSPLTWVGSRNYVFTISNIGYRQGVLFSDNIGMRVNGWNMTTNSTYMSMDIGAEGEMIITANWQAYANYGPALVLKNIESKEYYQNLINNGITYLTFDLKVDGADADKLSDVHILGSAQKVAECTQENGVYKVNIQLAHIVQFYDTITTLDTSGSQAGQWGSRSALLLAWRFSTNFATVPAQATRNYVFTISNTMYV